MRALTKTSILFLSGSLMLSAAAHAEVDSRIQKHQDTRKAFTESLPGAIRYQVRTAAWEGSGNLLATKKNGVRRSVLTSQSGEHFDDKRMAQSILTTPAEGEGKTSLRMKIDSMSMREQQTTTKNNALTTQRYARAYGSTRFTSGTTTAIELSSPAKVGELVARAPELLDLPKEVLKQLFTGGAVVTRTATRESNYGTVERSVRHQIDVGHDRADISREAYMSVKNAVEK